MSDGGIPNLEALRPLAGRRDPVRFGDFFMRRRALLAKGPCLGPAGSLTTWLHHLTSAAGENC